MEYSKINDYTLQETKTVTTQEEVKTYEYGFLKEQKARILTDINTYVAARKLEVAEIDILISEADKLGLMTKSESEIKEQEAKIQ